MKTIYKIFLVLILTLVLLSNLKAQPQPPYGLNATVGHMGQMINKTYYEFVNLQWQYHLPNTFVNYNIYRKTGAISDTGKFEKKYFHIPFTFWRDELVNNGQTYSYFVTAVNKSGESISSDTVQVTLDSAVVKAVVSGSLKSNSTGNVIGNGNLTFIPVFGWGMNHATTDSSGNYSVKLYPGSYIIYARANGFLPGYYHNVRNIFNATKIVVASNDSLIVNVGLDPIASHQHYRLTGVVKDTLGNPVKAFLRLHSIVANSYHRRYQYTATDDSGRYSFNLFQGDTVVVFARSMNHKYFPQFYNGKTSFLTADRIGINNDTSNINFTLVPKPVFNNGITGIVQAADSTSVESIVMAIRLHSNQSIKDMDDWRRKYSTETDSLGNYSFDHMIPGAYILLAIPEGDYQPTFYMSDGSQTMQWKNADSVIVDSTGIISGINFVVTDAPDSGAATVNGQVKDNSGNPLEGAIVYATDLNSQTFSYGVTDINGNYTISGLVPGTYTVNSDAYGFSSTSSSTSSVDYNTNFSSSASFTMTPENITSVKETQPNILSNFKLNQNYPNPFNPTTIISYQIPYESKVVLKVFNILGDEVATLVNENKAAGNYNVSFNASNLSSGVYFYQIKAGSFVDTKKLVLLK